MDKDKSLQKLLDGNKRFIENKSEYPNRCEETRGSLIKEQKPYAVILSCSDSRVPIEIIFDVGLGDIFVIRTAGHVLSKEVMGSIEFALKELDVKLVMILGHENCGAVKSAITAFDEHKYYKVSRNLQSILKHIYPAIKNVRKSKDQEEFLDKSIRANIEFQVNDLIKNDKFVAKKLKSGSISVLGAYYSLTTGKVEVFK